MKVQQTKPPKMFHPITLTIETKEEYEAIRYMFNIYFSHNPKGTGEPFGMREIWKDYFSFTRD